MAQKWIMFGMGLVVGGLSITACWGLFWSAIGTAGLVRGTCSWRILLNGLTIGTVPLMLILGLFWLLGGLHGVDVAFAVGMIGIPIVIVGFGLQQAPDGRRTGAHMFERVRHLMDEVLGYHRECDGCGERHQH